jgi:catechol 2,3-dioxygenase-like lactoylglutathione lyase family enzyme
MHPQPLIAVRDVLASRRWYQHVLGCKSGHGGTEYEQLLDPRGTLILQLHDGDAHEHSPLGDPSARPRGNGLLLWFQVEDSARRRRRFSRVRRRIPTPTISRSGCAIRTGTPSSWPAPVVTHESPRVPPSEQPARERETPRRDGNHHEVSLAGVVSRRYPRHVRLTTEG